MIVVISAEAEGDLEVIGDDIAKDSPIRALSFIRELRTSCLNLAQNPERFPLVPRFERCGVRRRVHGPYLIFYRIDADEVVGVHILHGAMDYAAVLFPS